MSSEPTWALAGKPHEVGAGASVHRAFELLMRLTCPLRWLGSGGNSSEFRSHRTIGALCHPDLRYLLALTCGASSSMAASLP
jgi:hypothetical protein